MKDWLKPQTRREEPVAPSPSHAERAGKVAPAGDSTASRIAALGPWFHSIDLGNGLTTKGYTIGSEPADHPRGTWEFVKRALPADLAGKTVLDVGCNAGFYSIQAKRRSAARVLGIDASGRAIRQAIMVRDILGLDIDYRRMSVYAISPLNIGTFDVTLALGLLYHCKHLILAVERLFLVTRGLAIIESAVLPERASSAVDSPALGGIGRLLHPVAYVANSSIVQESVYNWFIPSASALLAILTDVGFQNPRLVSRNAGRALITAWNPGAPDSATHPAFLGAELKVLDAPAVCRLGETFRLRVIVKNTGFSKWISRAPADRGSVRLGVHLSGSGLPVPVEGPRAVLTSDVAPGQSEELALPVTAPKQPGSYELELDMVSEHVGWFADLGATQPACIGLRVE